MLFPLPCDETATCVRERCQQHTEAGKDVSLCAETRAASHLGTGDEQSASSEATAAHAQLPGQGTTQKAVGDEAEGGLTELLDASAGGETRKPEAPSEIRPEIVH